MINPSVLRYKMNMIALQKRKNDKQLSSMERAIWWIEYVLRHKSVTHLRFSEADNPWYRRDNVDVIAFLSIILFLATIVPMIVLVQCARLIDLQSLVRLRNRHGFVKKNREGWMSCRMQHLFFIIHGYFLFNDMEYEGKLCWLRRETTLISLIRRFCQPCRTSGVYINRKMYCH